MSVRFTIDNFWGASVTTSRGVTTACIEDYCGSGTTHLETAKNLCIALQSDPIRGDTEEWRERTSYAIAAWKVEAYEVMYAAEDFPIRKAQIDGRLNYWRPQVPIRRVAADEPPSEIVREELV